MQGIHEPANQGGHLNDVVVTDCVQGNVDVVAILLLLRPFPYLGSAHRFFTIDVLLCFLSLYSFICFLIASLRFRFWPSYLLSLSSTAHLPRIREKG